MVKGVNRRVIEVQMPKDSGFDKALLYLSPRTACPVDTDTEKMLMNICPTGEARRKVSVPIAIMSVLTGLTAAAFSVILFLYLRTV